MLEKLSVCLSPSVWARVCIFLKHASHPHTQKHARALTQTHPQIIRTEHARVLKGKFQIELFPLFVAGARFAPAPTTRLNSTVVCKPGKRRATILHYAHTVAVPPLLSP